MKKLTPQGQLTLAGGVSGGGILEHTPLLDHSRSALECTYVQCSMVRSLLLLSYRDFFFGKMDISRCE